MNIRCLAVDDEPMGLRQLTAYLQKVPFFEVVGSCKSALEASRLMDATPVDALFIDINMPDLNGLDFVRSLREPPLVVFTTAYSEYALDAFGVEAVDYLLKPFGMGKLMASAEKVRRRYELLHPASASSPTESEEDVIFLKTDYRVVRVHIPEIVYVEGMAEYLRIYLEGQEKPIISLLSMKKLEERIDGHSFMRVHKSYIVNLKHIVEINRARIVLDTDKEIPIGASYRTMLNDYVQSKSLIK